MEESYRRVFGFIFPISRENLGEIALKLCDFFLQFSNMHRVFILGSSIINEFHKQLQKLFHMEAISIIFDDKKTQKNLN